MQKQEVSAKEVAAKVFRRQLRPYTVQQLWENTKKVVSKGAMQLAATDLVEEGVLSSKTFGKTVVYFPILTSDMTTDEFVEILSESLPETEQRASKTKREAKKIEKRAEALANEPTNDELKVNPGRKREIDEARVLVLESREFVPKEIYARAKEDYENQLKRWKGLKGKISSVVL